MSLFFLLFFNGLLAYDISNLHNTYFKVNSTHEDHDYPQSFINVIYAIRLIDLSTVNFGKDVTCNSFDDASSSFCQSLSSYKLYIDENNLYGTDGDNIAVSSDLSSIRSFDLINSASEQNLTISLNSHLICVDNKITNSIVCEDQFNGSKFVFSDFINKSVKNIRLEGLTLDFSSFGLQVNLNFAKSNVPKIDASIDPFIYDNINGVLSSCSESVQDQFTYTQEGYLKSRIYGLVKSKNEDELYLYTLTDSFGKVNSLSKILYDGKCLYLGADSPVLINGSINAKITIFSLIILCLLILF